MRQAPLVAQMLRSEPTGPRREWLLAVQLWFDAYRRGSVEALLKDGRADDSGQPDSFGPEVRHALEEGLKEGRWRTVPQMHAELVRTFGITLKLGSLYNRRGKAGARPRVPRPRHALQNPPKPLGSVRNCAPGSRP